MNPLTTAFLALFFAPLSFVYGRHVARTLHGNARRGGRFVKAAAWRRLVFPAVVLVGMIVAIEGRAAFLGHFPAALADTGGFLLLVWVVHQIGQFGLILFFLALPYVMGSALGVAAALSGCWRETPEVAPEVAIAEVAEE